VPAADAILSQKFHAPGEARGSPAEATATKKAGATTVSDGAPRLSRKAWIQIPRAN